MCIYVYMSSNMKKYTRISINASSGTGVRRPTSSGPLMMWVLQEALLLAAFQQAMRIAPQQVLQQAPLGASLVT